MADTTKICPLTKENCEPTAEDFQNKANLNCSFFVSDMFSGKCLYVEAMKAMPQISENIKKIKIQAS